MGTTSLKSMIMRMLGKVDGFKKQPKKNQPKSFTEKQMAEEAVDRRDLGIKNVSLQKIVGSVGRYNDFDSKFRKKRDREPYRQKRVKEAMEIGKPLPPVELYKIKDEYYILDGNHRVSVARQLRHQSIQAHIVEYLPSKETLANILYREKDHFERKTGLDEEIDLTEVGQYGYLLDQIKEHRHALEQVTETPLSITDAAQDWYNTVYSPLIKIINSNRLMDAYPKRTVADLYVYISYHQWHKGRETRIYGAELGKLIADSMAKFRTAVMANSEHPFPEMKRIITAFIMISVKPELEKEVAKKLYAYKEVRELHDVPAEYDLIVKIVLEKDLISSESEAVRQFVQEKVRRISGITWTQTIIPLSSRIKKQHG